MKLKFLKLVLIFATASQVDSSCERNDTCFLSDGTEGIAVYSQDCKPFMKLSNFQKRFVRPCGFESLGSGSNPLTCCPAVSAKAIAACKSYIEALKNGLYEIKSRILLGTRSEVGGIPHFASLGYQSKENQKIVFQCGGALISEHFVLTAAHCIGENSKPVIVRLGRTSLDLTDPEDTSPHVDASIEKFHVNPKYNSSMKYHDIALVELVEPVKFSTFIRPACLKVDNNNWEESLIIAGFGRANRANRGEQTSNWLMKGYIAEVPVNDCQQLYYNMFGNRTFLGLQKGVSNDFICAKNETTRVDTCQGDSGSALQYLKDDMYYIVGITCAGISCGSSLPSFYTRVPNYIEWIEDIVWKDMHMFFNFY